MSTSAKIIKNTGFLYAKMGITVFISLYTTRLILKALGAADFGIYGVVGGAITMLGFLNSAMASATQRFMSYSEGEGNKKKQKSVFNSSLVLHWVIAIVVALLLEGAMFIFFGGILNIEPNRIEAARWIYHFAVISTLFTIITVPYDAVINAHENMFYYAIVGILESVLKLLAAIIIVYSQSDKLILYGLFMAGITILMLIIKQVYCQSHYTECHIALKEYVSRTTLKEISGYAGWNFVGSIGTLLGNCGGSIIINHFFGTAINAAQNVGAQLRGQMLAFSSNMLKALNPVIVKKEGGGERNAMLKFSLTGCKLSYLMFATLAIPFFIEAPYILNIWLENVPEWTVCFSRFQIAICLMEQLTITLGTTLGATGKIKEMNVFGSIARFVPLFLYVPLFALGAQPYWLYIIIFINFGLIINGYTLYLTKKYCNLDINYFNTNVFLPCLSSTLISLAIGFCSYLFLDEGWLRLLASTTLSLSSYFVCMLVFVFNEEEKIIIKRLRDKLMNHVFRK
jgi:O-antigen/teichoic acid export membrane protein